MEEATLNLISPICIDGHTEIIESEVQIQPDWGKILHKLYIKYIFFLVIV